MWRAPSLSEQGEQGRTSAARARELLNGFGERPVALYLIKATVIRQNSRVYQFRIIGALVAPFCPSKRAVLFQYQIQILPHQRKIASCGGDDF